MNSRPNSFREARYRDGIIDSQDKVEGWPELLNEEPFIDRDKDELADFWVLRFGLVQMI